MTDAKQIAAGLTAAQRASMTRRAVIADNDRTGVAGRHTFQRFPTHEVLVRKGLIDPSGRLTPLGLAVRRELEGG